MTNFEFFMNGNPTPSDFANLLHSGCNKCIFKGKFEACSDVNVTCKKGFELWLQSEHTEKEKKDGTDNESINSV